MGKVRSLCHAFVLYPDYLPHMDLLKWLSSPVSQSAHDFQLMYILHQPEAEDKKAHYHVMLQFANARTASGVQKSFGVVKTVWRLYHMLPTNVEQTLSHTKKEEQKTLSGYIRRSRLKRELVPVLRDQSVPDSFIELEYHDGQLMPPVKPGLADEVYKRVPIYTVSHVENVSDFRSYAQYMIHNTYDCYQQKKRRYTISDVHGTASFIQLAFSGHTGETEISVSAIIQARKHWLNTNQQLSFIEYLLACDKPELVEYIRKNPYFISKFILEEK